jgi:hypothetical protein
MKICFKCGLNKSYDLFYKRKTNIDGYRNTCKSCESIGKKKSQKKYFENNRKKILENNKISTKEWRDNNTDKIKEYSSIYYIDNIDKKKKYSKEYYLKNKDFIMFNKNIRHKNRIKVDFLFKLKCNIRSLIYSSLKNKGYIKNTKSEIILGCSHEEFKKYLESKFEDWMTWDNYGNPKDGIYELNKTWDIDHIIPLDSVNIEEDLIKLNHYTNLQPLCSIFNRTIKKNKIS